MAVTIGDWAAYGTVHNLALWVGYDTNIQTGVLGTKDCLE